MNFTGKRLIIILLTAGACLMACRQKSTADSDPDNEDWKSYGGNKAGNRYSPLKQINTENIKGLQLAWSYDTGENDNPDERGSDIQCQPIVVDGILYGTSPS